MSSTDSVALKWTIGPSLPMTYPADRADVSPTILAMNVRSERYRGNQYPDMIAFISGMPEPTA